MTYFGFLFRFLLLPIALLLALTWQQRRRPRPGLAPPGPWSLWAAIALHCLVALLYTTPWDNYLVATGVWWYDPALVTGVTIGWVPIEEYTFFILQPVLAGLWLAFVRRRLALTGKPRFAALRLWLPALLAALWLAAALTLASGWQPGVYLALILVWALPPLGLQLAFGADILWQQRRLILLALVPLTLYLSAVDALAIGAGTWTIDPAQTLNIYLGGILPIEEFLFFLATNTLLTFGIALIWAPASHQRLAALRLRLAAWQAQRRRTGEPYSNRRDEARPSS